MKTSARIGIVDWGIGGIGIRKLLSERAPGLAVTYLSDTGVTPYGRMGRRELSQRLDVVISYLRSIGVTHLIVGCNAASTALPRLKDHGIKVLGMIDSAVETALKNNPKRLGLIGGRQTVLSGIYRKALAAKGITVKQRIAQPLSALIEIGDVSSNKLASECERILRPLRSCSHILLACTHYPAVMPILEQAAASTVFIDPAPSLVDRVSDWKLPAGGQDIYLTTGDIEQMRLASMAAFGWEINAAKKVKI
jgi:glutamate racemase